MEITVRTDLGVGHIEILLGMGHGVQQGVYFCRCSWLCENYTPSRLYHPQVNM